MALPSSKYAEDTSARQTLANGTVLKWTSQVGSLYALNDPTDLSICYTNWNDPYILTKATKTLSNYYTSCDLSEPDMGLNESVSNDAASGWTRKKTNSPRIEDIYAGVVIANNAGYHYWGYSPLASSKVTDSSGNTARFLLDMDVNKMLFKITITAVDKTTLPTNEDYEGNWTSKSISTTTITLKQLYENPTRYLVTSYSWGGALVYGENTTDHWRSVSSIYPAFILNNGDSVGGFIGKSVFGSYVGSANLSFSKPNGHVSSGGGSSTYNIYSHLDEKYVMGHPFEFTVKPDPASYSTLGARAQLAFIEKYGDQTASTHTMYIGCNLIDAGDGIAYFGQTSLECQLYINPTPNLVYRKLHWTWNRYIKGETFLAYLAAFGLYFLNDNSYDPDSDNITPDTLGDTDKIWLGEMLGGGVTTGRWITDLDSYTGPNKNGKTSNPDYDPSGGGGSTGDDMEAMATGASGSSGGFTHFYVMSPQDLIDLLSDFYDHASSGETISNNLVCSYILGIPSSEFCATEEVPVAIHNSAQGTPFVSQADYSHITATNNLLVIGSFKVPRMTNTFYDFAPYSTYEVFIPCCGWVSLPDTVAGRSINVEMYIDIASCCLKAAVKTNDLGVCAVTNGVLGAAIPMAVIESGILRGNNIQAGLGIIGGGINAGVGAGSGNAMSIGFGVQQILSGLVECTIAGNTNYTQQKGGTGDITQFAMGHKCYMKVTHPDIDSVVTESIFGHSVGYLCNMIDELSNFHGFTVCGNPHVHISATSSEKEEIKRLLEEGVILP